MAKMLVKGKGEIEAPDLFAETVAAGLGPRVLARFIDSLIIMLLMVVPYLVFYIQMMSNIESLAYNSFDILANGLTSTAAIVVLVTSGLGLLFLIINLILLLSRGATIGMAMAGIRWVTIATSKPSVGSALGKGLLESLLFVAFPFIVLFSMDHLNRHWFDRKSGIIVLNVRQGRDPLKAASPAPVAAPAAPAAPQPWQAKGEAQRPAVMHVPVEGARPGPQSAGQPPAPAPIITSVPSATPAAPALAQGGTPADAPMQPGQRPVPPAPGAPGSGMPGTPVPPRPMGAPAQGMPAPGAPVRPAQGMPPQGAPVPPRPMAPAPGMPAPGAPMMPAPGMGAPRPAAPGAPVPPPAPGAPMAGMPGAPVPPRPMAPAPGMPAPGAPVRPAQGMPPQGTPVPPRPVAPAGPIAPAVPGGPGAIRPATMPAPQPAPAQPSPAPMAPPAPAPAQPAPAPMAPPAPAPAQPAPAPAAPPAPAPAQPASAPAAPPAPVVPVVPPAQAEQVEEPAKAEEKPASPFADPASTDHDQDRDPHVTAVYEEINEEEEDDLERTMIRRPSFSIRLNFDDGSHHFLVGKALVGRSPEADDAHEGAHLISISDPGRSISKLHMCLSVQAGAVLVEDMKSLNGTTVVTPEGTTLAVIPGAPVLAPVGSTVYYGDRSVKIGD